MHKIIIDGHEVVLHLLDSADDQEFSSLSAQTARTGHGFLLIYDITNAKSLEILNNIWNFLRKERDEDYPVV